METAMAEGDSTILSSTFENKRQLIDPEGRYPAEELRGFESYALQVLELLPGAKVERTSDVIQINFGDFREEQGLVVVLTPDAIELRLPTIEWLGPHTPVSSSQLWKRVKLNKSKQLNLSKLIASAWAAQKQTFGKCLLLW